ncbi:hypothetical protein CH063_06624, partial [Colletotrichum higginsianum]
SLSSGRKKDRVRVKERVREKWRRRIGKHIHSFIHSFLSASVDLSFSPACSWFCPASNVLCMHVCMYLQQTLLHRVLSIRPIP